TDSLVKDQRAEETSRFSQTRQDHSVSVKRFLSHQALTVNTLSQTILKPQKTNTESGLGCLKPLQTREKIEKRNINIWLF
ncbi:hypothetical protein NKW53_14585, partial [Acetobacter orientalis]|uniref:hypothetical protein n=1 Tax=Acetobacter orientalis TaxID=146474 RepID=UPI00209F334A